MSILSQDPVRHAIGELLQDYEWFHTLIGVAGNVTLLVGSVLFLHDIHASAYLFIGGSTGMLIGSIGQALVRRARRREGITAADRRNRAAA